MVIERKWVRAGHSGMMGVCLEVSETVARSLAYPQYRLHKHSASVIAQCQQVLHDAGQVASIGQAASASKNRLS